MIASLLLSCSANEPSETPAPSSSRASREKVFLIAWDGASVALIDDEGSYTLEASRVVYRNRRGAAGFLLYHDLADLSIHEGRLSIESEVFGGFASIPETIDRLLPRSLSKNDADDGLPGEQTRTAVVTRLVLDRPFIELVSPQAGFALSADHGLYDVRSATLALDGEVVIRAPEGEVLRAPRAILARAHRGLYMPRGHELRERVEVGAAFAVLDDRGVLSTTVGGKRIAYEDLLEKREWLVLQHYAEHAPPAIRPLLIAILSAMASPRP